MKYTIKECVKCGNERPIFSKGRCKWCAQYDYNIKSMANAKKKRKNNRKKKRQKLSNLKKQARMYFQRYIRLKAFYENDVVHCAYGCGKILTDYKKCDAGHFLKAELYPEAVFDEQNVYPVCKGCNIRDPSIEYRMELVNRYGQKFMEDLEKKYIVNKNESFKWDRSFLENIKNTYREKCKEIEEEMLKSKTG